jgi:hypothetical protein
MKPALWILRAAALFVVVSVCSRPVSAQSAPAPAGARPAQALTTAAITALTLAAAIDQSLDRIDRNRLGDQNVRLEATGHVRRALDRSREAQSLFSKPLGAAGDPVRKSADGMRAPFSQLSSGLNQIVSVWDKMALVSDENEIVEMVRTTEGILANERPWEMLVRATQDLTLALLDISRAGVPGDIKTVRHLRLTRDEREAQLARLEKAFPAVTSGARGGRAPDVAAGILHEFLTRPYASEDEP